VKELKTAEHFADSDFIVAQAPANSREIAASQPFSSDAFQAVDASSVDTVASSPETVRPKPATGLSIWLGTGLSLVSVLALLQWASFVQSSLASSVVQGGAALALTGFGAAALARLFWSAWRGQRQRNERQLVRDQGALMQHSLQYGQALSLCQRILKQLPVSNTREVFRAQHNPSHSDAETLQLFDLLVLQPLDQQAASEISAAAKQAGVAVALSPFALADMVLVSWRAWRLLADLAALYGVKLGAVQRWRLVKKFTHLLFWTGATELAIDIGGDFFGVELSSKLSARAGQGMLAGLMLARLGRFAQQELRPLPMLAQQTAVKPLLQGLLQRLLQGSSAQ
jgi:putative membrane protein